MKTNNEIHDVNRKQNLKHENEILKQKLSEEFGMQKMESCLPEEIENDWLNYMYNFERMNKEAVKIKVSERLGNPEFSLAEKLDDNKITFELDRLNKLMEQNGIDIDFICKYEERLMYKFITEELFEKEIEDIRIPEMRTCFIYEEFHPNHEYDIKNLIEEFFEFFLQERFIEEFYKFVFLEDNMHYKDVNYTKDEFLKKLIEFREEVKPSGVELLEFYNVNFDLENCCGNADGEISYSVKDSEGPAHVSTFFNIKIKMKYGFWEISEVEF